MNDRILKAIRREPVDATPVWFMRQAGRTLPRYRESRAERDMLSILKDPPAAAEITAMPLDYFPVDACVLYNDLVTPFVAAGLNLEMRPGIGPVVHDPILEPGDVSRLKPFEPRVELAYTMDQIKLLVKQLDVPVLGFLGAPFTLFRGPFGAFMHWAGGIPVDRGSPHGVVGDSIAAFSRVERRILVIAPEGTRRRVERFKPGFLHIARGAGVPVMLATLDYGRRRIVLGPTFAPGGDIEAELRRTEAYFAPVRGKRPRER